MIPNSDTTVQPQGVSHPTFRVPPVDGSINLADLFEYDAEHSPEHVLFRYEDNATKAVRDIKWSQAIKALRAGARLFKHRTGHSGGESLVVGILANTDSITYATFLSATIGLGLVPFPISPRNTPAGVAHLLNETNCKHVFVSADLGMQQLATAAQEAVGRNLGIFRMPTFGDLYDDPSAESAPPLSAPHVRMYSPVLICHSSGTTRFPSPITMTQHTLLNWSRTQLYGEVDLCGTVMSMHAPPFYHMMGNWAILMSVFDGFTIATFPPNEPPIVPTTDRVLSGALATHCDMMFCVPLFLEMWATSPGGIEALKRFKIICYAGGPLSAHVGEKLFQSGIKTYSMYGSTETGLLSMALPKTTPPEGWHWMKWSRHTRYHLIPYDSEDDESNVYRLIVKANPDADYSPGVINTVVDGVPAYDTKDLVLLHPTNPSLFKVFGRFDEQIMHSTGEKTNPIPIEAALCKDERISGAIMFGREKFQPGVLIIPARGYEIDPTDESLLSAFRTSIWETVQVANEQAPQHSRIFKEMILVVKPSKPVEYTIKGTPKRPATLAAYGPEIEALYAALEEISHSNTVLPSSWSPESTSQSIRTIVHKKMNLKVGDDDDIFASGGDSLIAAGIRNSILGLLRMSKRVSLTSIRAISPNFVFDHPSISLLSAFTYALIRTASSEEFLADHHSVGDIDALNRLPQAGETIVELYKGNEEPPLIVVHGGGGIIYEFVPFAERFHSSVWGIQLTPDAPLTSLEDLAAFYVAKIKEKQATAPYRLAGYSGSNVLVVIMALLLEASGEKVTQLAFLDSFPAFSMYSADTTRNADQTQVLIDTFRTLFSLDSLRNDKRTIEGFTSAFTNPDAPVKPSAILQVAVSNLKVYTPILNKFVNELSMDSEGLHSLDKVHVWLRSVQAPMTVYVADKGVRKLVTGQDAGNWQDLGAQRAVPSSEVIFVAGGHFEFLWNQKVIDGLQAGY